MLGRLVLISAIAAGTATPLLGQASPLDRAKWLAGCWELRAEGRLTTEMWMLPAGGLMLGASRTVVNGVTRESEHLRIRADGDKLTYIALPSGQKETAFPVKQVSENEIVFENPAHDFPQRIIYRRRGADSVVARIEGPGPNNSTRGFDFPYRRVNCTAP